MYKINPHRTENYQKFLAERESRIKELTDLLLSKIDGLVEQIREELNTFSDNDKAWEIWVEKNYQMLLDRYDNKFRDIYFETA